MQIHLEIQAAQQNQQEWHSDFIIKNNDADDDQDGANNSSNSDSSNIEQGDVNKNQGTLIIDATCAPSDIAYPTDLELLDKARIWCKKIYDTLVKEYGTTL